MKLMSWMILVVVLLAVGLAVTALSASQGPAQVPVYYEPAAFRMAEPVAPDKAEYENPVTVQTTPERYTGHAVLSRRYLPDLLLPIPDPPSGGTYESVITHFMVASRTETVEAWRWAVDEMCYDFHRSYPTFPGVVACDNLRAYLTGQGGWWTPERVARELSFVAIQTKQTAHRIQAADGSDKRAIPSWPCAGIHDAERGDTCQLGLSDTEESLVARGLDDADLRTEYLALVGSGSATGTHTTTTTLDVTDPVKVKEQQAQYQVDLALILAHNEEVQRKSVTTSWVCDAKCESDYARAVTAYNEAVANYDSEAVLNQRDIDAYLQKKTDRGYDMYVDCQQSGCILVNPVRP